MSAPKLKRTELFGEFGATGVKRYGSYIQDEFIRDLDGIRGRRIYRQMAVNDAVIGGVLFAIDMQIRQLPWTVEAVSSDARDVEAAEFLASCKDDMSHTWEEFLSEVGSMFVYGFAVHELVYKVRKGNTRNPATRSKYTDGRIGWRKIAGRAQDTILEWDFQEDGGISGCWQQAPPQHRRVYLPIEKMLLFRTRLARGNPEGRSVLRNAYRAYYMGSKIENIEAIGIERDLAGLPVVWVPPRLLDSSHRSASETASYEAFKELIVNLRRDEQEGVVMPLAYDENGKKLYDLTLLSTGGTRQFDTDQVIARYDQRKAISVLADFILLGHEGVGGNRNMGADKMKLFQTALNAFVGMIESVLNRYAVPRLFALNSFRLEKLPKFVAGKVESVDLDVLGNYISALAGTGVELFPDDALEAHLREVGGLPEKMDVQ